MKKKIIIIFGFSMVVVVLLLLKGYDQYKSKNNNHSNINSIIIYNYGTTKKLKSTDEDFEKILKVLNYKIDESVSQFNDKIDDNKILEMKNNCLSLELILNEKQTIKLTDKKSVDYTNLFFKIEDNLSGSENVDVLTVQIGLNNHYNESSIGHIKQSKELIDLVKTISNK